MAATLINATGLQFGIKEDEDGLIIEKVSRSFKDKSKPVLSKQGETIGFARYDKSADITISGLKKATGSLVALAVGAIVTDANVANETEGHGVTGGSLILNEVSEDETQEDFLKIDLKLTRYPLIPSA